MGNLDIIIDNIWIVAAALILVNPDENKVNLLIFQQLNIIINSLNNKKHSNYNNLYKIKIIIK